MTAYLVAAIALTTGAGLLFVAAWSVLDRSFAGSMADRVWCQSAGMTGALLLAAGTNTVLQAMLHWWNVRAIGIALYLVAIGGAAWGVSTGLDLLCVREHASTPIPEAILSARFSIGVSAISAWVGIIGLLATAFAGRNQQPVVEESAPSATS